MGYTHYFETHKNGIPESAWEKIVADVKTLFSNLPKFSTSAGEYHSTVPLVLWHEYDEPDTAPEITDSLIMFNGNGELGHETFYLERVPEDHNASPNENAIFNFCKTARKPYDLAVCGVLIVAAKHAGRYIKVSSDGDLQEWMPAFEWVTSLLGSEYGVEAVVARLTGKFELGGVPDTIEPPKECPRCNLVGECICEHFENLPQAKEPEPEPVTTSHLFIVDAKELRAALELAVSEKKTTIPILTTVRLEPSGSNLLVTSSDLDKYTVTNVTAMFDEAGAGAFLLPHRKTLELLKGETGIVRITPKITTHKNNFTYAWVNLHVGGCDYDLPTMDPSNFPETPKIPKGGIIVPAADFKAVLGRVMPAISTEESRYTLNGGLFDVAGNKLIVVTTDGHRLALDAIRLKGKNKDRKAVIAHEALTWLHKQAKGDVKISLGTDKDLYSFFHVGNTTLISRNLTGQFPNYHSVLPRENEFTLTADFPSADELSKTLVKVARMADERSGAIKLRINGAVTLSAESSASGKASAPVKASINNSGKEITIGLNSAYVLDVLKVAGKNPVALSLKDAQSAGVFTVPSLPEYSYILMPMRI